MSQTDVAQICENGHVVNSMTRTHPEDNQPFCSDCGQPSMMQCKNCKDPIKGYEHGIGYIFVSPKFCHKCGKPYPWTERTLDAAKQYASELEGLNEEEKKLLSKSIEEIAVDSPYRQGAVARFKKILAKVQKPAAEALMQLVSALLTEGVKKNLGL